MRRKVTVSGGILKRHLITLNFKSCVLITSIGLLATLFVVVACSAPQNQNGQANTGQQAGATDWKPVEQALGKAGSMQPGDVYKVSFPRSDLKVTVGGVELKPALALGSWLAFKKAS